ncbi:MAG: cobyric acid synthase [Bacillota bacterium]
MAKARTIMVQGTASNAGKSIICTALCRIFRQDGWRVAPFKAQNMALNSYITKDGKEIGRAQGVQAEAAGIEATVEMNPVLLKPKQDMIAQVVVLGRPMADMSARDYRADFLPDALGIVRQSLDQLRGAFEVVVLEGAGSPAEVNLKDRDIVNMRAAEIAEAPVLLVADIDRGGVFAALVGTLELLEPLERERVAGFVINKFRGDLELLKPGLEFLEQRTGKPVLGVIPYIHDLGIDEEDSVSIGVRNSTTGVARDEVEIAVIQLPRISNFTDFDALARIPSTRVRYVKMGQPLGYPDAIILPGTKNTVQDMLYLREQGYSEEIMSRAREGAWVVGICGGYQMLGKRMEDPQQVESDLLSLEGLGLLDVSTTFYGEKATQRVTAEVIANEEFWKAARGMIVEGYEIHMGRTELSTGAKPLLRLLSPGITNDGIDGAVSLNGRVFGTYLHGLFDNDRFCLLWINELRRIKGLMPLNGTGPGYVGAKEAAFERLAAHVRQHLDMERVYRIMGLD